MTILGKLGTLTKISDFLHKKFLAWEQERGKKQTVTDFGKLIGINQAQMSLYMAGKRQPHAEHKDLIIRYFGDEAIIAFGEDPDLYHIQQGWNYLEPSTRQRLRAEADKEARRKRKTPAV